jgi:hypothetical protein
MARVYRTVFPITSMAGSCSFSSPGARNSMPWSVSAQPFTIGESRGSGVEGEGGAGAAHPANNTSRRMQLPACRNQSLRFILTSLSASAIDYWLIKPWKNPRFPCPTYIKGNLY